MSSPPTDATSRNEALSLSDAMKVADYIRKQYNDEADSKNESGSSAILPGLIQGISAFAFTGLALLPVRRLILQQASSQPTFRHFVDLGISVGHALVATQVGFLTGSLYGSSFYLQEFAQVPPTMESPLTDRICDTMWKTILPPHLQPSGSSSSSSSSMGASSSSWDPRIKTMESLQHAIGNCQRRQEYRKSNLEWRDDNR
jgi:hypothetical protein